MPTSARVAKQKSKCYKMATTQVAHQVNTQGLDYFMDCLYIGAHIFNWGKHVLWNVFFFAFPQHKVLFMVLK